MVQWYVEICLFAVCTSPIIQLVSHPKLCITFFLNFFWVLQLSQEKMKTMLVQNVLGESMVHYVR